MAGLGYITRRAALGLAILGFTPHSAMALDSGWQLVGVYDATSLVGLRNAMRPEEDQPPPEYVWVAAAGMAQSCGPAKAPDGLGVFEAEGIANQLFPVLAIMLERTEDAPEGPLRPEDVRVSLALDDDSKFHLEPAVTPRTLRVEITGEGVTRYKQLIRTQLEMELCMEHKTGRGWMGGGGDELRQAFLLEPPDEGGPDRKFFGGQRDPVPALLGPADACLVRDPALDVGGSGGGQGEGSLDLVPTDVWGAGLRWCSDNETAGAVHASVPRSVPLKLGQIIGQSAPASARKWTPLQVVVGPGMQERDVRVDVSLGDEALMVDSPLFEMPDVDPDAEGIRAEDLQPGLHDLLAQVPYTYPELGPLEDPDRYALLLVPNWQIIEGLRRLHVETSTGTPWDIEKPMPNGGAGVLDGVGWVLHHPEVLMVQVPSTGLGAQPDLWLDLAEATGGGTLGIRAWGYTAGMLAGRKPIGLPGAESPTWNQASQAQRAVQHSLFLGAFAILGALLMLGFRRLPDLWTTVPEERVAYWPSKTGDEEEEEEEGGGEMPGGGGGEK